MKAPDLENIFKIGANDKKNEANAAEQEQEVANVPFPPTAFSEWVWLSIRRILDDIVQGR